MPYYEIKRTNMSYAFKITNYNTPKLYGIPIYDDGFSIANTLHTKNKIGFIKYYNSEEDLYEVNLSSLFIENNKNINFDNISLSLCISTKRNHVINLDNIDLDDDAITIDSAVLVRDLPENNIICLCGSTKFKKDFEKLYKQLSLKGYIVLMPCFLSKKEKKNLSFDDKRLLKLSFRKKINLANTILVVNKNDYIGEDTKDDILFATSINKPIEYMMIDQGAYNLWLTEILK